MAGDYRFVVEYICSLESIIYSFVCVSFLLLLSLVHHDLHITHWRKKKKTDWNKCWQQQTSAQRVDARKLLTNLRHGVLPPATVSDLQGVSLQSSFLANVIGVPLDSKISIILLEVSMIVEVGKDQLLRSYVIMRISEKARTGPDWIYKLISYLVRKKHMNINIKDVRVWNFHSTVT